MKTTRKTKGINVHKNSGKVLLIFMTISILFLLTLQALAIGNPQEPSSGEGAVQLSEGGKITGDGVHYLGAKATPPGDYRQIPPPLGFQLFLTPLSVDLSSQLPPIGDQGAQGSCASWAIGYYYKSWQESKEHTGWNLGNPNYQFSPSFLYHQFNGGEDVGAYLPQVFNVLESKGDVDIAEMPYNDEDLTTQPTAAQLEAAKPYRIAGNWGYFWYSKQQIGPYSTPNNIQNVKAYLTSGKILVMTIPIYEDFPNYEFNPASKYYDYNGSSIIAGLHAVCICGYDDNVNPSGADADHKGGFKMANSWGASWNGDNAGYVYLSYDFVKRYVLEAWAMYDVIPDGPSISGLSTNGGVAGDTIHIYGKNFGTLRRNARVSFNGVNGINPSFTDGDITVTVPAGATGPIIVYDWDGAPSNQVAFTIGAAAPRVTSIWPYLWAQGLSVDIINLAGSNFASGATVSLVQGSTVINATNVVVVSATKITCTFSLVGVPSGYYDLVVKNSDGNEGRLGNGFRVLLANPNVVLCSLSGSGVQGNSESIYPAISSDGKYVAFESNASNLVSGDSNGARDVFRRDITNGQTVRCSTNSSGVQGNGNSLSPSISADGRYAAFQSFSSDLVSGDTNATGDIFRKDLVGGQIVRCSTDSSGIQGNALSLYTSMSPDGRYVVFTSAASNLVPGDTNGAFDVFRKDLTTGQTVRCSTNSSGTQGNSWSTWSTISSDGRYVAFQSYASNLVSGDTNGVSDIFRKDLTTGQTVRCSTNSSGGQGDDHSYNLSMSPDGRYVAISSYSTNLVSGDTNKVSDIFRKDLTTGQTVRCSTDTLGKEGDLASIFPSISSDGRYVAFESAASNLVPGSTLGVQNVFRKDLTSGQTVRCSSDDFGKPGNGKSENISMSPDGKYVAFASQAYNLVTGDANGVRDIFRKDCTGIKTIWINSISPTSGTSGIELTISGYGFGSSRGTSEVQFGMAQESEYLSWSDTQIVCRVPSNIEGEVMVKVVTAQGSSNGVPFTYIPPVGPSPTVSSITPNTALQYATVDITNLAGSGFETGATVRLEQGTTSIIATNVVVASPTSITCTFNLTGQTGPFDVIVRNPNGGEGRLNGGFTVNPCGTGAGGAILMLGLTLGLLSLVGSFRGRNGKRRALK